MRHNGGIETWWAMIHDWRSGAELLGFGIAIILAGIWLAMGTGNEVYDQSGAYLALALVVLRRVAYYFTESLAFKGDA